VIFCQATVTYTPVTNVSRHGLSPNQSCVTRLRWALSMMTVGGSGVLMCMPEFSPFLRHQLVSWWLNHPYCQPLLFLGHQPDLLDSFHVSLIGCLISCLPPEGAVNPDVAWLPTAPTRCLWSLRLVGGEWLPQNVPVFVFWRLASRSTACSLRACLRATFSDFFPPNLPPYMVLG
jgi:hypothetical protein